MKNNTLVYACCAPCALPILDYFKSNGKISDISLFFFNSNILSEEEYDKRLENVWKVAEIYMVDLLEEEYNHLDWLKFLKSKLNDLKSYKENGLRCQFCFEYRLEKAIKFAKDNEFDSFCSTLQTNLYKDTEFIIKKSKGLCKKYGLEFVEIPLDKKEAYQKGILLCKKFDIYRQKFCGCEFSFKNK